MRGPFLLTFRGRAGRVTFATVSLACYSPQGLIAQAGFIGLDRPCSTDWHREVWSIFQGVRLPATWQNAMLASAALALSMVFVVWISFEVRRLHDLDRGGWWVLPHIVVAALSPMVLPRPVPDIFMLGAVALSVAPGSPGRNRFGPSPRGPAEDDIVAAFL